MHMTGRDFEDMMRRHIEDVDSLRKTNVYFLNYMVRTKSVFEDALAWIGDDASPSAVTLRGRLVHYIAEIDGTPNPEDPRAK